MKIENLEHSQKKFTFEVKPEEFETALDKAFQEENAKVSIPGFRKGHAPRSVFEKTYGVEYLFSSAVDVILNDKVQEIFKDQEELTKTFIGQFRPSIEKAPVRGKKFEVALIIDVQPEVTLPDYKSIEVKAKDLVATDKEVEDAIKAITRKDAKKADKADQTIALGNYATFDFVGSVDGKEFEGGKAENYELEIGSGQFIPGFEDQMVGMKVGEVKDVNVTFPEQYQAAELAGKAAVFKVTIHKVQEETFPELNEEYVKSLNVADATNLDELKAAKKKEIEDRKAVSEKDRQFNEVVQQILDATNVDMPQTLIEERVNQFKAQYENQAKAYNIPFATFLQIMGTNEADFNKRAYEEGSRQALFNVVASAIIDAEKLTPTTEELNAQAEEDSKKNHQSKEQNLQANIQRYYSQIAYNKLVECLLGYAKEVKNPKTLAKATKAEDAEKPAKKTTAKKATTTKKAATKADDAEKAEKKTTAKKTTTAKKATTTKKAAAKADDAEKPAKKTTAKKTTTKKATTKAE